MDIDIAQEKSHFSSESHFGTVRSTDGLSDMPECYTDRQVVRPSSTIPDGLFFRHANVNIIITPCDNSISTEYQQAELRRKMIRRHRKISKLFRKKKTKRWLNSYINERRLRSAASSKDKLEIERLITTDADMDLNACDDKKRTALHIGSAIGADDIVRLLLENGASPNVKDTNANTPLHLAACSGHIRTVTLLLHYGGDIYATDANGKTPLHLVLARQKLFQKSGGTETSRSYSHMKRRAQLKDIAELLRECLMKKGAEKDKEEIAMLTERIPVLSSDEEVYLLDDNSVMLFSSYFCLL